MNFFKTLFLCLTVGLFSGCMIFELPKPMTPLELQSLQSREYEESKKVVFQSIISVFQDLGYTVTNADIQTGLISAEGAADSWGFDEKKKTIQTKATAFVEKIGKCTKARLSFVEIRKTSSLQGQESRQDYPVYDVKTYENAFEKIESGIFLRSAAD